MSQSDSFKITKWLTPNIAWRVQANEYYAAHFLVGAGLLNGTDRDEELLISLAYEFGKMFDQGHDLGRQLGPGDFTL